MVDRAGSVGLLYARQLNQRRCHTSHALCAPRQICIRPASVYVIDPRRGFGPILDGLGSAACGERQQRRAVEVGFVGAVNNRETRSLVERERRVEKRQRARIASQRRASAFACANEARFVCCDNGLNAAAQSEFCEHGPDMALHRLVADEEFVCDVAVRLSPGDE